MPIYEYQCTSCSHELEALQKFSDPLLTECPACGTESLKKKISAAGFQLKGSGWYATDFKGGGSKPASKPSSEASGSESKAATSDSPAGSCGAGGCAACS